jgi:hypothetical protein
MISSISDLFVFLNCYASRELSLKALHDELSLGLQVFLENASEEDVGFLSEIHSAIYEIEDGLLDEEEFRRAVKDLYARPIS